MQRLDIGEIGKLGARKIVSLVWHLRSAWCMQRHMYIRVCIEISLTLTQRPENSPRLLDIFAGLDVCNVSSSVS